MGQKQKTERKRRERKERLNDDARKPPGPIDNYCGRRTKEITNNDKETIIINDRGTWKGVHVSDKSLRAYG